MAIILLTNNSRGIGQTIRCAVIGDVLAKTGAKPVFFAQGQGLEPFFNGHIGKCIPYIGKLSKREQVTMAKDIENYALLSEPSVLIEDTYPLEWCFPGSISRALVIGPTDFSYLKQMRKRFAEQIGTWLMADSPGSPTWPYNPGQTKELLNWPNVEILGPIYRKPNAADIKAACKLISHDPGRPVCLFTMGSNEQLLESDYVEKFGQIALLIRVRLKSIIPDIRCIFVKGPLIDSGVPIPAGFEILERVDCLPALVNISFAAVIKPGFNLIWECINGRTPFFAIDGETLGKPIGKCINYLRQHGLYPDSPFKKWTDESFRSEYERKCSTIVEKFSGVPQIPAFEKLVNPATRTSNRSVHMHKSKSSKRSKKRVLFVADNGIGIGHVIRSVRIAVEMQSLGHDVHLVFESSNPSAKDLIPIPFTLIPNLSDHNPQVGRYDAQFEEILDDFDPHAVVFDRHLTFKDTISNLLSLRFRYRAALSSVPSVDLLAGILERKDVDKTIFLHSVKDFRIMYGSQVYQIVAEAGSVEFAGGPIYPKPLPAQQKETVKVPREPFVVFINGGGGEHYGKRDTEIIARVVNYTAQKLIENQNLETIFIGGPNFKHYDLIDRQYVQCVTFASNIIELMKAARVTVLRPGFNLTREAYDSARAIVALQTYQYQEATRQHLSLLMNHPAFKVAALDGENVYQTIILLLSPGKALKPPSLWQDGSPAIINLLTGQPVNEKPLNYALEHLNAMQGDKRLVIRVDDVVTLDEPLHWLLTKLSERKLCTSLEIIPYHTNIRENHLQAYDPSHLFFEVSQHGYSHLSIQPPDIPPGEFPYEIDKYPYADEIIENIRQGRNFLVKNFPNTFAGGFSAPYDACPAWLSTLWAELGGKFISTIFTQLLRSPIPVVQVTTDPWNWDKDRLKSHANIFASLASRFARHGQAGLVFHHKKLTDPGDRADIETLLNIMIDANITSIKVSDWVLNNSQHQFNSVSRQSFFQEKPVGIRGLMNAP